MAQEIGAITFAEASPFAEAAPGEPPERVRSELVWRLAARLYHDHGPGPANTGCVACRQPWPCSGRRLAELGLMRAIPSALRDQGLEALRDQRAEALRDQGPEALRDQGLEALRDQGLEALRDQGPEALRDQGLEALRDQRAEAPRDERAEGSRDIREPDSAEAD